MREHGWAPLLAIVVGCAIEHPPSENESEVVVPNCDEVAIADPDLVRVVRERLGLTPDEALTPGRIIWLFELDEGNEGILDLSGLECAVGLEHLSLRTSIDYSGPMNEIADIAVLADLPSLRRFDLMGNRIDEVVPFPRVEEIGLADNPLHSIAGLAGSDALTTLDLSGTQVVDPSPAGGLASLLLLSLSRTPVSDLSGLAGSTSLVQLSINDTSVADLSPLVAMGSLQRLYAASAKIVDLPEGLSLHDIVLSGNAIVDVSPIASWDPPDYLNLSGNAIDDVSPLLGVDWDRGDDHCVHLSLSGNPLSAPGSLQVLQQLCDELVIEITSDLLDCTDDGPCWIPPPP